MPHHAEANGAQKAEDAGQTRNDKLSQTRTARLKGKRRSLGGVLATNWARGLDSQSLSGWVAASTTESSCWRVLLIADSVEGKK
eukprot:3283078-Amphidinium_carterae.1